MKYTYTYISHNAPVSFRFQEIENFWHLWILTIEVLNLPWPISVTHGIITTGNPIFTIMSCYVSTNSCYYQQTLIIRHLIFRHLNNLLSNTSCYYQHLAHRCATGRALAYHVLEPGFKSRSDKKRWIMKYDIRFMAAHISMLDKVFFG